jgi:hypothetical protein
MIGMIVISNYESSSLPKLNFNVTWWLLCIIGAGKINFNRSFVSSYEFESMKISADYVLYGFGPNYIFCDVGTWENLEIFPNFS